jgi:adenylate kinase
VNIPPKKEGICDKCGGELIQRADDNEETAKNRIDVYNEQTRPLVDYYEKAGNLARIDGATPLEQTFKDIVAALGE